MPPHPSSFASSFAGYYKPKPLAPDRIEADILLRTFSQLWQFSLVEIGRSAGTLQTGKVGLEAVTEHTRSLHVIRDGYCCYSSVY
jgi:hypothetical protein